MRNNPKTAVVVVNWEQESLTFDCLYSLNKIVNRNLEIILVDNGSRDGSGHKLAERFPKIGFVRTKENKGYASGVNKGIWAALQRNADYIFVMNNDTVVDPGIVDSFIEIMEMPGNASVGVCVPKIYYHDRPEIIWYAGGECDPTNGFCKHWRIGLTDDSIPEEPTAITFANGCSMFIRREVIEKVGYFDESYFHTGEDADYSIRTIRAGYRLLYVPKGRLWHKVRASTEGPGESRDYIYYEYRNRIIL
jgi:GT2 family glycosyltransferase